MTTLTEAAQEVREMDGERDRMDQFFGHFEIWAERELRTPDLNMRQLGEAPPYYTDPVTRAYFSAFCTGFDLAKLEAK